MGHNPVPPAPRLTRESFHLGCARRAYFDGEITVERFEECVGIVLNGGTLPRDLRKPPANPSHRSTR